MAALNIEKIRAKIAADKARETEMFTRVANHIVSTLETREWTTGVAGSCTTVGQPLDNGEFLMSVNRAEAFERTANSIDPSLKFYVFKHAKDITVCLTGEH